MVILTLSTLAQVMACCLTAQSLYMGQCWLIMLSYHQMCSIHTRAISQTALMNLISDMCSEITLFKISYHRPHSIHWVNAPMTSTNCGTGQAGEGPSPKPTILLAIGSLEKKWIVMQIFTSRKYVWKCLVTGTHLCVTEYDYSISQCQPPQLLIENPNLCILIKD